ncbi:hypothetical protein L7F22_061074 [Adiantum nelumboides]|nr:hypothetical protein [Adiantum nelumboides]
MGGSSKVMDGSNIKALVGDPRTFAQYVDDKFRTLDKTHNGKLSREELVPVALAIGNALGLPPKGSSKETDHIYDEVLSEFLQGKGDSITKEEFTPILRDMLLGVADGLERDPVVLRTLSGSELESYANSSHFEVNAVGVFTQMEKGNDGKIPSSAVKEALEKISVGQGMPPASDDKIAKDLVEPALQSAGVLKQGNLSQDEFLAAYRKSLLSLASLMKEKPVTVAHTEKCFDGTTISRFLKDESVLHQTLNDTWISLGPFKAADGTLSKSNLRVGLDLLAPFAGLPPVGAVDEMDHVVGESMKLVDAEKGGFVDKDEFSKCMLEVLGGIMLQLEGKSIAISLSVPAASDANPDDCLKL